MPREVGAFQNSAGQGPQQPSVTPEAGYDLAMIWGEGWMEWPLKIPSYHIFNHDYIINRIILVLKGRLSYLYSFSIMGTLCKKEDFGLEVLKIR